MGMIAAAPRTTNNDDTNDADDFGSSRSGYSKIDFRLMD